MKYQADKMYKAYKGRQINFNKPVKVYKNLHNGLFSVMQDNLVVAHVESFTMHNVVFKVNEKARQRVILEKKKNVHAFVAGMLIDVNSKCSFKHGAKITYNPYKYTSFIFADTEKEALLHNFEVVHGHSKQGLFLI